MAPCGKCNDWAKKSPKPGFLFNVSLVQTLNKNISDPYLRTAYFSAITSISKSDVVNAWPLENSPSLAPKISIFL